MIGDDERDEIGLWKDPLKRIFYTFRPQDPPDYGHICPHCQLRYGDKSFYITLRRCDTCPSFMVGLETPWVFTKKQYNKLKNVGYFDEKPKGKKSSSKKQRPKTMLQSEYD